MLVAGAGLAQTANPAAPGQTTNTTAPAQTTNAAPAADLWRPLEVKFQPGEFLGNRQIVRERIQCGTNEFMLVVPEDTRAEFRPNDTIAITSSDGTFFITFRIAAYAPDEPIPQPCIPESLLEEYPFATNIDKFGVSVAGRPGAAVSFKYARSRLAWRQAKIIRVPCKAGVLEFTLDADEGHAKTAGYLFQGLLLTFRSDERGKIKIIPFSNKS